MHRLISMGILAAVFLVTACGESVPVEQTPTAVPPELTVPAPAATLPAPTEMSPYPVPPPESTPLPAYPQPPLPTAAADGYPLDTAEIWIIRPVGEQCAPRGDVVELQTAVAGLIAIGVPVSAREMVQLDVCQACGCPTSAHFRVRVPAAALDRVRILGWEAE